MAENAAALIGSGLHKRFLVKETGQTIGAVTDVSLEIPVGTLTALVGPDGAGKTTLLRMMAGLMVPDEGRLEVLGIDVAADPQAVQDRISYMPQRFGLYEDLSVQENLDLYADLHGVPSAVRSERYRRLLHMTNLAPFTSRPAGKLSGGMKQKLGLACTLVRSPELLLLDEPTVGVDPLSRVELWDIILQMIRDEHLTVLITTAYLDEAERCAQVFVLHEGKLLTSGAPADIRAHARGRVLRRYALAGPVSAPPAGAPAGGSRKHHRCGPAWWSRTLYPPCRGGPAATGYFAGWGRESSRSNRAWRTDSWCCCAPGKRHDRRCKLSLGTPHSLAVHCPSDEEVVIEVKDLVRAFGDFIAVDHVSFSVCRGEIFGLLGPNGAGKTTTFRMLCGLLPASSGFVHVAGVDLRHARAVARRNIGYVSQKFSLYGDLSVRENLEFFGSAYGLVRRPPARTHPHRP